MREAMAQTARHSAAAGQRPVIVGEAVTLARIIGVDLADMLTEPSHHEGELAAALAELGACERSVHELKARAATAAVIAQDAQAQRDEARTQVEAARWHVEMLRRKTNQGSG